MTAFSKLTAPCFAGALALSTLFATAKLHAAESTEPPPPSAVYRDPSAPVEARVADLLARMSLAEKIGQMAQAERGAVGAREAGELMLGSVLSGGGSAPSPNTPASWASMIDAYQSAMGQTRLGIPLIYGIDAVHGHQSVTGATVFPHLLGLAATRDPALLQRVGQVTSREMAATGIYWNFSPMVAITQDLRWGRAYESFGEDPALVTGLGRAYARGLMQSLGPGAPQVLPTAKHFIGDGGTAWNSARQNIMGVDYALDQGDTRGKTSALLDRYLPPYKALIDDGVLSVMASFSSWNGHKLHGEKALLTDVLKGRLGFKGFVVSDWDAIQQLPGGFQRQVAAAVNAGVDMAMVPNRSAEFVEVLAAAVARGQVKRARIDDAVRRILRAKFQMGLFEQSRALPALLADFGGPAHRAVAREAVAKSMTLLKNQGALPLARNTSLWVVGSHADNLGLQSGGWTQEWQGVNGNARIVGTTLLDGLKEAAPRAGLMMTTDDPLTRPGGQADVGLVLVGETPYAEGVGDRDAADLRLSRADLALINALRPRVGKLVLVVVAGRPLLLGEALAKADAVVMAYLPGSEGAGLADVLLGARPFSGRLPIGWPKSGFDFVRADEPRAGRCASQEWATGFGLDVATNRPLGGDTCRP
jgi:beta-glucosidase